MSYDQRLVYGGALGLLNGFQVKVVDSGTVIEADDGAKATVDESHVVFRGRELFVVQATWDVLHAKTVPLTPLELSQNCPRV